MGGDLRRERRVNLFKYQSSIRNFVYIVLFLLKASSNFTRIPPSPSTESFYYICEFGELGGERLAYNFVRAFTIIIIIIIILFSHSLYYVHVTYESKEKKNYFLFISSFFVL